jgi:two-component system chemotaxis response regulator CheB
MTAPTSDDGAIRVMIVEDSATARIILRKIVDREPGMCVVDTAGDPFEAAEKMRVQMPDVMLLDIEMPRMDGLTFLRRIMAQNPLPVVICSNHTPAGSSASLKALEIGAVEALSKSVLSQQNGDEGQAQVRHAIRAAAQARISRAAKPAPRPRREIMPLDVHGKLSPDVVLAPRAVGSIMLRRGAPIVGLGASTGGTVALAEVLQALPADAPPIAVVQHMPEKFTEAFAKRLDSVCRMHVKEAADGDRLERGQVLVAPGNRHLIVERLGRGYVARLSEGPPVSRHRPSVDVLFRSLSIAAGPNALGVIMTGMGEDGAQCLLEMQQAGATTLAQDEASCVVYGMPRVAVARGGVDRTVPLHGIAEQILKFDAAAIGLAARQGA